MTASAKSDSGHCRALGYRRHVSEGASGPLPRGASRTDVERAFPEWEVTDVEIADNEPDPLARLFRFDERFYRLRRGEHVGGPRWQERLGSREQSLLPLFYGGGFRVGVFCRCGGSSAFASDVLRVPLGSLSRQKGRRYPADPPRVEEIAAVMRLAGEGVAGDRIRGLIVVLWRAGLRIPEALDLYERDLDPRRGALLVRSASSRNRRHGSYVLAPVISPFARLAAAAPACRACRWRRRGRRVPP